jgi:hypothetical protein
MTKVITVSVAGFRYNVYTRDGEFALAIPTSKAHCRKVIELQPDGSFQADWGAFSFKMQVSGLILAIALQKSKSIDDLVKAIGGATEKCAICGAILTDPVSTAQGVGPECVKKIIAKGITRKVIAQRLEVQTQ